MKAFKIFQETILSEIQGMVGGIAGEVGGELGSLTNYDTSNINGLLDNVNKTKVSFVKYNYIDIYSQNKEQNIHQKYII